MSQTESNSPVYKASCLRYVFFAVLGVIAVTFIACMASGLGPAIFDDLSKPAEISAMQQKNVDWVISHAYPGSNFLRADGYVSEFNAGSSIYVVVTVTFDTSASFSTVKAWYSQHPEGGRAGGDSDSFPDDGLVQLSGDKVPKTIYRVTYLDGSDCAFLDCKEPLHQIR